RRWRSAAQFLTSTATRKPERLDRCTQPFACLFLTLLFAGCRSPHSLTPSLPHPLTPSPLFQDVADAAGIRFRHGHGGRSPLNIRETIGTGCAFLDADGDGRLDLFLVGESGCALYRNRGPGAAPLFEEVSGQAGLPGAGAWSGCAVGDWDGDGRPD